MNEERFERELRDAAHEIADAPAPKSLHAYVVAIPVEHPSVARRAHWFGVVGRLATTTAGLVLLVIAGTFVVATRPHDGAIAPIATGGPPTTAPASQQPTSPTPAGPTPTGAASTAPSSTGASADRYPDGLPRTFDGQPVLRGPAARAHAVAATDATPFLVGGWVTFIPGSRFCPLAPADGASWARDCIQAQLADAAGTTDDALTAAITFHFVLSGLISGPIVARVEVHDPRATTCGSAVAECDRMMVVQQVLWTGDAATAPGPITAGTATAAVSSVQGGAGLAPLGPSPAFFACSLTLPTATILLPATMTDTVPGVVEVDVEPTTAARKMALDVGQGVGPAFSRTPLCRGMSGNKGTITNTEDRSLVVANVAVVVHLHGSASAADRAFVDRLVAALEAAASAGAGPTPTPTPMPRAVAPCTSAQLTISTVDSAAEAGTAGAWLRFLNVSAIACSLHGWPSLVGVTASGVATVAQENTSGLLTFPAITGVPTVTLSPGDAAFAAFAGSDNPGTVMATCPPPYQSLRVAPPGSTASVSMSAWNTWLGAYAPACAGLAVTFIVPSSSVPELEPLRP